MNPLLHTMLVILLCALTTVIVECLYWSCFKPYRTVDFLAWCAVVNFTSNILLNTVLFAIQPDGLLSASVLVGEGFVVALEYLLFLIYVRKNKLRLFVLTFFANLITYSIGFLL